MKALVLEEYNKLVYKNVPTPSFKKNEVLIKVMACGICGSDVHGMDGSTGRRIPPVIMGHEASGIIEQVGYEVKKWTSGQRVTFDSTIYKLEDWFTLNGMYNLSEGRKVLGVSTEDYRQNGAFAEYIVVPEHILYQLPEKVSFEEAAMVEPVAVACHALGLGDISYGDTAVVVGAGMIGLFIIQLLKNSNAKKIIAIDLDNDKLELANKFGADISINPKDLNINERIKNETDGRGADVVFEAVGIEKTVNASIENVRNGGTVVLVGNLSGQINFPLQSVVTRQLRIQGSCAIKGEYPIALGLIEKGIVNVKPLLSASAPLSEGASWFSALYNKTQGLNKVILKP